MVTTIMKNTTSSQFKINDHYSYKKYKKNDSTQNTVCETEYRLKSNNFNPSKPSPNMFLTKLEFRMKHYYLEEQLLADTLTL